MTCGFLVGVLKCLDSVVRLDQDSSLDWAFLSGSFPLVEIVSGGAD